MKDSIRLRQEMLWSMLRRRTEKKAGEERKKGIQFKGNNKRKHGDFRGVGGIRVRGRGTHSMSINMGLGEERNNSAGFSLTGEQGANMEFVGGNEQEARGEGRSADSMRRNLGSVEEKNSERSDSMDTGDKDPGHVLEGINE